jgi:hypothetical protein
MNDEGTVVELIFQGDDRVFLSSPTFALWRRKIKQPPLTLSRTKVLVCRYGLTLG